MTEKADKTEDPGSKIRQLAEEVRKVESKLAAAGDGRARRRLQGRLTGLKSQLAWHFVESGRNDEALRLYESLPSETMAEEKAIGISRVLIEEERFEEARNVLEEALEDFTDSAFLLNNYGILLYRTGDQYEALRYFDAALECGSEECDTATRYNKGLSLYEIGYFEEAAGIFRELTERDPDNPKYVCELAQCELGRKNIWESILLFRRCLGMDYEIPGVWAGLCRAHIEGLMMAEAVAIGRMGLNKYPDECAMYQNLGEACIGFGWYEDAREVLTDGIGRFPECEALKELLERTEKEEGSAESEGEQRKPQSGEASSTDDGITRLLDADDRTWN
jgi:tetratricopeptide (TPR) repeat protein